MTLVNAETGERIDVRSIPIGLIDNGPAVRRELLDDEHAKALYENVDSLPMIKVRITGDRYQLIDGRHRLAAHKFAHRDTIAAEVYDVDDRTCWLMAVEANVKHGRGLSLAERRENARVTIEIAPDLSNREIGRRCGLDHKTVGKIRPENEGGEIPHSELPAPRSSAQDAVGSSASAGAGAPPAASEFAGEAGTGNGPTGDESPSSTPSPATPDVEPAPEVPSDDPAGAALGDDAEGSQQPSPSPAGSPAPAIARELKQATNFFTTWDPEQIHALNDPEITRTVELLLIVTRRWADEFEATEPQGLTVIEGGRQ